MEMMVTIKAVVKNGRLMVDAPTDLPDGPVALKVVGREDDPVRRALDNAPIDDEPETPEEAAAVAEARESVARGEVVSHEEMKRRLNL